MGVYFYGLASLLFFVEQSQASKELDQIAHRYRLLEQQVPMACVSERGGEARGFVVQQVLQYVGKLQTDISDRVRQLSGQLNGSGVRSAPQNEMFSTPEARSSVRTRAEQAEIVKYHYGVNSKQYAKAVERVRSALSALRAGAEAKRKESSKFTQDEKSLSSEKEGMGELQQLALLADKTDLLSQKAAHCAFMAQRGERNAQIIESSPAPAIPPEEVDTEDEAGDSQGVEKNQEEKKGGNSAAPPPEKN